MGNYINPDGTDGFEGGPISGEDLNEVVTWHGPNDPTAANNQIPANGLFFNTADKVLKINTGTVEAPIWKPYYQFPVYGRESQSEIIDADTALDGNTHKYGELTINENVTLSGTQKQNLVIICKDKLTINGTISMTGLGANGNAENSKNLDVQAGANYQNGNIVYGGGPDVYNKPNVFDGGLVAYGASTAIFSNRPRNGGGRIIIYAPIIEFGANGKIESRGQDGAAISNDRQGGSAGGDINIITATALTADQKAKIAYSDNHAEHNGTDATAVSAGIGGKARLTEFVT